MGDMADWWEDQLGYLDDEDDRVTCKYCGTDDLYWDETPNGWRLFNDGGGLHICKEYQNHGFLTIKIGDQ